MSVDGLKNQFALDVQSLSRLKHTASQSPEKGLSQAADQFEAVFLQMMLKSMRDAIPQSDLLSSNETDTYTSMLDKQWAQKLTGNIGLSDMLVEQLQGRGLVGRDDDVTRSDLIAGIPRGTPKVLSDPIIPQETVPKGERLKGDATPPNVEASPSPVSSTPLEVAANPETRATQAGADTGETRAAPHVEAFLSRLREPAEAAAKESGVPASLILAQAALETGWGEREIPTHGGGNSHNLFGIKAGDSWEGDTTSIMTTEYVDGRARQQRDEFRVYDSFAAAFKDYAQLIGNNPRYAGVVTASSPENAARALQSGGYATDPNYADKVIDVMAQIDDGLASGPALASAAERSGTRGDVGDADPYGVSRMPSGIF
ncbi:flagellar protein FlgJ [Chromohalobacter marismortui]|uniref:Peptidoglycan hydrolase FlgJ n=1 Tax=Chromohalobacter marismortui TaxID=42055 RepID=A0A4R7NQC3_9GAMM|nr:MULTISPECIES: flagellar assembly peptidoglycan hydrolase FlgJ [Chromohalobacter]MCI0508847.1 flagellar assembly peptidoglycan hydrolase FlgJ [Chromohalobacter sp.]MCI0594296.1 flagellar assembly peptidoglycan hydrolase FlgJ [Chromohalobacter sp.]TDU22779.1 flagellar protein FlgJ [Chromohalobacter marismortui]